MLNSVFLKSYNTAFDDIIIICVDQNCRPLQIEYKVTLTINRLLINRNDTLFHRTKYKKMRQRIWIFVSREKYVQNTRGKTIVIATKTRLDAAKPVSRNVFHKTVEATGELIGNKIARKL